MNSRQRSMIGLSFVAATVVAFDATTLTAQAPDLHGTWTNGTLTPFERPAALADRAFITEEEAAALERESAARRANPPRRPGDIGGDHEAFVDSDPNVYERPWTFSIPMTRDSRYQIFEYACHEGNEAVRLILGAARSQENLERVAASQPPALP